MDKDKPEDKLATVRAGGLKMLGELARDERNLSLQLDAIRAKIKAVQDDLDALEKVKGIL